MHERGMASALIPWAVSRGSRLMRGDSRPDERRVRRPRIEERRAGLADIIAAVAAAFAVERPRAMRVALEEAVARVLALRCARLSVGQVLATGQAPMVREGGVIEMPISPGLGVLQAVPLGARGLDEWDLQVLRAAADLAALVLEVERAIPRARSLLAGRGGPAGLVGSSPAMCALRERIQRVARREVAVLIEGESGVGKELVARQIHDLSARSKGPFVAVNCAALVESLLEAELFGIEDRTATGVRGRRGKFELADGGTLFLDEIADLSLPAQAKLLRALQEQAIERVGAHVSHRVDVRIVAATNRSLSQLVDEGRFRLDLYYRLNGVEIRVPPLRARRADVAELIEYFLRRSADGDRVTLSPDAYEALLAYDWPGNVRELERVIERAVTLADSTVIGLDDLPTAVAGRPREIFQPSVAAGDSLRRWATRYVRLVLRKSGYNKRQACRVLDISYHTLQAYLREGEADLASTPSDPEALPAGAPAPALPPALPEPGLSTDDESDA
jgi:transcriptional regulator with PAS, ATPase and Fis domain